MTLNGQKDTLNNFTILKTFFVLDEYEHFNASY